MSINDPSVETIMTKYKILNDRLKVIAYADYWSTWNGRVWLNKSYYDDPRMVSHK